MFIFLNIMNVIFGLFFIFFGMIFILVKPEYFENEEKIIFLSFFIGVTQIINTIISIIILMY